MEGEGRPKSDSLTLVERLKLRLEEKNRRNGRYSLRAFARDLGISHSHLSRVLRNQKQLSPAQASALESGAKPAVFDEWRAARALELLIRGHVTTRALSRELSTPTTNVTGLMRSLTGRGWVFRAGHCWRLRTDGPAAQEVRAFLESFHRRCLEGIADRWGGGSSVLVFSVDPSNWERVRAAFLRFQVRLLSRFHDATKPPSHGAALWRLPRVK